MNKMFQLFTLVLCLGFVAMPGLAGGADSLGIDSAVNASFTGPCPDGRPPCEWGCRLISESTCVENSSGGNGECLWIGDSYCCRPAWSDQVACLHFLDAPAY